MHPVLWVMCSCTCSLLLFVTTPYVSERVTSQVMILQAQKKTKSISRCIGLDTSGYVCPAGFGRSLESVFALHTRYAYQRTSEGETKVCAIVGSLDNFWKGLVSSGFFLCLIKCKHHPATVNFTTDHVISQPILFWNCFGDFTEEKKHSKECD